jgi:hypothetical protein
VKGVTVGDEVENVWMESKWVEGVEGGGGNADEARKIAKMVGVNSKRHRRREALAELSTARRSAQGHEHGGIEGDRHARCRAGSCGGDRTGRPGGGFRDSGRSRDRRLQAKKIAWSSYVNSTIHETTLQREARTRADVVARPRANAPPSVVAPNLTSAKAPRLGAGLHDSAARRVRAMPAPRIAIGLSARPILASRRATLVCEPCPWSLYPEPSMFFGWALIAVELETSSG